MWNVSGSYDASSRKLRIAVSNGGNEGATKGVSGESLCEAIADDRSNWPTVEKQPSIDSSLAAKKVDTLNGNRENSYSDVIAI